MEKCRKYVCYFFDFVEGDDIGTYSGNTNSLEKDSMYHFFQRISKIPGVYIAQGEYLGQEYLNTIYGTYQNVLLKTILFNLFL